jgi:hypothetical protein
MDPKRTAAFLYASIAALRLPASSWHWAIRIAAIDDQGVFG